MHFTILEKVLQSIGCLVAKLEKMETIIDREAGEIIRLVVSVHLSVNALTATHVRSIQNGWAFKMVVVSTGCAIAVDHAFNFS